MTVTEKAYAKLNLFLNVKGVLENGFHDLEMVNITVGLADDIEYTLTEGEVSCVTTDRNINGKNNLAYKVAVYLKKLYQVREGVAIRIRKNIPVGGGLGGGSADAAATFLALNRLWSLGMEFEDMLKMSKNFGSDIPYCLYRGPAVVTGTGDAIEPIDLDISAYDISLFSPKVSVSTGTVFSNLTSFNKYPLNNYINYLKSNDFSEFMKGLRNDLQDTVFSLYPEVGERFELLKRTYGEDGLFMTGSGSTIVRISRKN